MAKPEDVIARVLDGEVTREEAIRQHPDMRDRLTVLGELAEELAGLPRQRAPAEFRSAARLRILEHVLVTHPRRRRSRRLLDRIAGMPAWARRGSAAILVGGALTAGTGLASASALPDDALYPVKRTVEQVQLTLAVTDKGRANAYLGQADQRAAEMSATAGHIDDIKLESLIDDYGQALEGIRNTVQQMAAPSPHFLNVVQIHLASQATELEARAVNSQSKPSVQQALVKAEAKASNVSDRMILIAEAQGRSGPNDVRLAANAPAAATAVAETQRQSQSTPAVPAQPVHTQAGSAEARLPVSPIATPAGPVSLAGLDTLYDRVWNQVAAAPFMGSDVRLQLEQSIATAKQETRDGQLQRAVAELNAANALLQRAVSASQATEYTANRLNAQLKAIVSALSSYSPASSSVSRDYGLRLVGAPKQRVAKVPAIRSFDHDS